MPPRHPRDLTATLATHELAERPPNVLPPVPDRPAPNDYPWQGSAHDEIQRLRDEIARLRAIVIGLGGTP